MSILRVRTTRAESGGMPAVLDGRRSPIDRVAARVVSKGESYDSRKVILTADQRTPIATRKHESVPKDQRALIGLKFGRMTVTGLSTKSGRWAVRCDCGIYTLRTAHAIRNPNNADDCCEECRHLLYLKRNDVFKRTGKSVKWASIP